MGSTDNIIVGGIKNVSIIIKKVLSIFNYYIISY